MGRQSADAAATIPGVSAALHDTTLDDIPDIPVRPLPELVRTAAQSNAYADDARYAMAGQGLGAVLAELHVHAVIGCSQERQTALVALAEACMVAYCLAYRIGHADLAVVAARRGFDSAVRAERPDLVGMLAMSRTVALMRVGATSALVAARDGRASDVSTHLAEARSLAAHTGERNHLRYHFGPTNVAGWELSIAAENGDGPDAAERFAAAAPDLSVLGSKCREGYVRFALARCWSQADGSRDGEALRALDTADRLAPVVVRNDPIARELVLTLDRRAKRQVWELDSLRHRFGVGGQRSHIGEALEALSARAAVVTGTGLERGPSGALGDEWFRAEVDVLADAGALEGLLVEGRPAVSGVCEGLDGPRGHLGRVDEHHGGQVESVRNIGFGSVDGVRPAEGRREPELESPCERFRGCPGAATAEVRIGIW